MFGLRYHVASLAAVFVALALGILLGVAVSGKLTDFGEDAERRNLEENVEQLEQELDAARAQAEAATAQGEGADELFGQRLCDAHGPAAGGTKRRGRVPGAGGRERARRGGRSPCGRRRRERQPA